MIKKILSSWVLLLGLFLFPTLSQGAPLKIGVTAGPHADIMEQIKERAFLQGLSLEIIEFNDFILPNVALAGKELDANSYQHALFLKDQVETRGYDLVSIGKTILLPLGAYSKKIHHLKELKKGDKIALPNDPTNESRALFLLQKEGLLTLKEGVASPSLLDIADNPLELDFIEVEAPQLPRLLEDVVVALINTDWVLVSGLDPNTQIACESLDSPYANVLVVRREDANSPSLQTLLKIYHSPETAEFIQKKFGKAVIPAWID